MIYVAWKTSLVICKKGRPTLTNVTQPFCSQESTQASKKETYVLKGLYVTVHGSIFVIAPKPETAQMSISRYVHKQIVACPSMQR